MDPVADYRAKIAELTRHGATTAQAARYVAAAHPALALRVLDIIGMWPSSEPEFAALQRCCP